MILRYILAVSLSLIVSTAFAGKPLPTVCLEGVVYYKMNGDGFNKGYGYMAPKWLPSDLPGGKLALCGQAKAAAEARDAALLKAHQQIREAREQRALDAGRAALERLKEHDKIVRDYLESP